MIQLDIFFMGDQPTVCPFCGNRTEIIIELYDLLQKFQIHKCLSIHCNYIFIEEESNL